MAPFCSIPRYTPLRRYTPVRKVRYRPRRGPVRDEAYKAWIRTFPCLVCQYWPTEAAHTGRDGGMRQKASDRSCVPLCANCHTQGPRSYHRIGRKRFERRHRLNFRNIIARLNEEYRGIV